MQERIPPLQWTPSGGIILEENATTSVKAEKNVLVVAGPGAGKTELLAQKTGYLFQTNICTYPKKILAISFKTDAAANLKERIESRYGKEYAIRFSSLTYDAFAKKILDQFRNALPEELCPSKDYIIGDKKTIDAAFKKSGYLNPRGLTPSRLAVYYENVIATTPLPVCGDSIGSNVWRLLIRGFDDNPSCLTFKMISMLTIYIFSTNPYVLRGLQATYSHVFLDEFQDTTSLQYDLVKMGFQNSNSKITAVGDNKQRIMVWAGARKTIFEDFQQDFNAMKIPLLMNHRSAPRLVDLQKLMYTSLQVDLIDLQTSKKWEKNDGDIKLYISENEDLEAKYLVADITEKISNGVSLKDICILVKQLPGNYIDTLVTVLSSFGIKARIETEYQDILKEFIVVLVLNTLKVSINRRSPTEWEYVNNAMEGLKGFDSTERSDAYDQEHINLINLLNATSEKLALDITETEFHEVINNIIQFFDIEKIKALYPTYAQGNFFEDIVNKMIDLLWKEFEECNNWNLSFENFQGLYSIPIMTIHKSKGLEYTAVYFVGLEDGAFWSFRNQPEEDRCAFFVALSRAKEFLSFSFCAYRHKLRNPNQKHTEINEFFELLKLPGISTVINCD
ncbi:UvrD-helicase domain-containing protein [Lacrimispora saccharolytica]|uniref:DNA 3'-5' helicase n=1 Tax=Lacrimispora saccharolytica (strain ATCC 35040 / DSM 2544 / NRCC 2533 / WM1) TaxID=610130 RepID=D9RA43_LACSW|nr:ATP-dependent helicase [Lacrimispora saccharolytica]ADL06015.1 UvrD/REP helicase [[Clostridium] saccharolyticum WM1]QRV19860.1 ATP-dependent helicase [Lacrimispora saccharolytica]